MRLANIIPTAPRSDPPPGSAGPQFSFGATAAQERRSCYVRHTPFLHNESDAASNTRSKLRPRPTPPPAPRRRRVWRDDARARIAKLFKNPIFRALLCWADQNGCVVELSADAAKLLLNRSQARPRRQAARRRRRQTLGDAARFRHVRLNRRHDNARFSGQQINAGQGHPNPGVDDNALVEYVVEDVDHACAGRGANDLRRAGAAGHRFENGNVGARSCR